MLLNEHQTIKLVTMYILIYCCGQIHTLCFPRNYWHVERRRLHFPDLIEVARILGDKLQSEYHYVKTEVIDCPDLKQEPFKLSKSGFTGSTRVLDIGSLGNIIPYHNANKSYSLVDLMSFAELNSAFAFGAGAGPFKQLGFNSEGVYNFYVKNCTLHQHSISVRDLTNGTNGYKLIYLDDSDSDLGLLGNLFASKGLPGKVVRLHVKQRKQNKNEVISNAIRRILHQHYGKDNPIGLGLIGLFRKGIARTSVMPGFISQAVPVFANWTHYFQTPAPFVMLGTIVTEDQGLNLYTPHVHFKNEAAQHGGHFITDLPSEIVEYDILLNTGEYIYRVDQPAKFYNYN